MSKFRPPSSRRKALNAFMQAMTHPASGKPLSQRSKRQQRKIEAAVKRSRVADEQHRKRARRPTL